MSSRFQLSAGGVVYRRQRDGRLEVVLVAVRSNGRWTLPKGLVETGESLEQAALREVREETGLRARIIEPLPALEFSYWWQENEERELVHKKVHYYLMEYLDGDTADHDGEVQDVRWLPVDAAMRQVIYQSERDLLGRVKLRAGIAGA